METWAGVGRRGVARLAGLAVAAAAVGSTQARALRVTASVRRVTLLLGFAEGAAADQGVRDFLATLAPLVPEMDVGLRYLPGDGGCAMLAALGQAAADGATIGWVVSPTLPSCSVGRGDPSLGQHIRVIGAVERESVVFVAGSAGRVESIRALLRRAGDDDAAVRLATPPAGSPPHLAALRLRAMAGARLDIVTFPSAAAARQAVLGGQVAASVLGLSSVIRDIRERRLNAIGVAAASRSGLLADVPTLAEAGIPLVACMRRGLAVPAGTPAWVTETLGVAMQAVARDESFRARAEAGGYEASWIDAADWLQAMQGEQAELARLWATEPWLSPLGR